MRVSNVLRVNVNTLLALMHLYNKCDVDTLEHTYWEKLINSVITSRWAFQCIFHSTFILFIFISLTEVFSLNVKRLSLFSPFTLDIWVDCSIIWQPQPGVNAFCWRCSWFILHSVRQRPELWWIWPQLLLNGKDWFSRCETSTKKWASGREQGNINQRERRVGGRGMKSLLAPSTAGIHQRLSRQLPCVGNELVLSVCVLKQAGGTLILPNQRLFWHVPSVIFLLLFSSDIKTKREKTLFLLAQQLIIPLCSHVVQLYNIMNLHLSCGTLIKFQLLFSNYITLA